MIRCLVIEDNSFDRKIVRQAAMDSGLGIVLHEASSIRAAEDMLNDESFDCILVDFRLPDGDGLSFAKRILARDRFDAALIMLTAEGSEQLARQALHLGILDYIPKRDLGPETLERSVSNALAKVRLSRERQAALDELKRSNEALGRFAGVVAHDLRAPIRQMQTFSAFLSEDHRDVLGDDGRDLLDRIEKAAERAFKLIDGMLAYARLDKAGELHADASLRSAVDDAVANLAAFIDETNASIEIGDLPTITGVESQLMQLFQNLINNALKFSHPERQPLIRIEANAEDGDMVEIAVQDNGIGIAAEHQERIFNMLERLHGQGRYEGSGIGLAMCQRIVENHGGRIWCDSKEDHGSRFVFTLARGSVTPEARSQPCRPLDSELGAS